MLKTPQWQFCSARELFEAARDASHDAERIRTQLIEIRERSVSVGGGGFEPRVSSTPDPQRMQNRANALMDRERTLRQRQAEDEQLMDLASDVLYGRDDETGLSSLVPTWWCDVLWWHYLDYATWEATAKVVGYSEQRCKQVRSLAFDIIDSWGIVGTMRGTPLNDVDTWAADRRRELWRAHEAREGEKH